MSSLKRAVNSLNPLKRAEEEEVWEVLTTCTGAGSVTCSTQLLCLGESLDAAWEAWAAPQVPIELAPLSH